MYSDDWINLLKTVPEKYHSKLMLTLTNGTEFIVETIFRYEPNYLLFRGRLSGTTDEGRTIFVPYDQLCAIRIDEVLTGATVMGFFGDTYESRPAPEPKAVEEIAPTVESQPAAPADPKDIARANLLEKIRAARAGASGPSTSRPTR